MQLHFTLLSLKRICILQLMITSKIYGMVSTKCKWISRCIHYKNNSIGWHQYDSFSIQHSNGHRHKTPAIATCFTFYTTVSPLRRKYMEERRERVIRLCLSGLAGTYWVISTAGRKQSVKVIHQQQKARNVQFHPLLFWSLASTGIIHRKLQLYILAETGNMVTCCCLGRPWVAFTKELSDTTFVYIRHVKLEDKLCFNTIGK